MKTIVLNREGKSYRTVNTIVVELCRQKLLNREEKNCKKREDEKSHRTVETRLTVVKR